MKTSSVVLSVDAALETEPIWSVLRSVNHTRPLGPSTMSPGNVGTSQCTSVGVGELGLSSRAMRLVPMLDHHRLPPMPWTNSTPEPPL